jgi:hypothetical protein
MLRSAAILHEEPPSPNLADGYSAIWFDYDVKSLRLAEAKAKTAASDNSTLATHHD